MHAYNIYDSLPEEAKILIALAIILLAGFLMTRITKVFKLPNVTAYITAGVLIGPYALDAVPPDIVKGMSFINDIALAFIAFGIGKFFKRETLKSMSWRVVAITLSQSLTAGVLVTLAIRLLFGAEWRFCLLLGAISTATAPASTMMTINQYHARGRFVETLLQVVALDDVVCLLTFSTVIAAISGNGITEVMMPILYNIAAIAAGFLLGLIAGKFLVNRSKDNKLMIMIAILAATAGICTAINVSPLLACMVFGAAYINVSGDEKIFKQITRFSAPITCLFFMVSGMNLNLPSLASVGMIGVSYFAVRIIGKFIGAYTSCRALNMPREITANLGFALVPQAGVAISLAYFGFRALSPTEPALADMLLTIILASSVLYELVGPACGKFALFRSGAIVGERRERLPLASVRYRLRDKLPLLR